MLDGEWKRVLVTVFSSNYLRSRKRLTFQIFQFFQEVIFVLLFLLFFFLLFLFFFGTSRLHTQRRHYGSSHRFWGWLTRQPERVALGMSMQDEMNRERRRERRRRDRKLRYESMAIRMGADSVSTVTPRRRHRHRSHHPRTEVLVSE